MKNGNCSVPSDTSTKKHACNTVIDKQAYYRGAAIFHLVDDERMETVVRVRPGFLINDEVFVLIKYTAKLSTPWQFTFSPTERDSIDKQHRDYLVVLALVCGDDGICAVRWDDVASIVDNPATWIAVHRKVNKRYKITGNGGEMQGRVPRNHWPGVVFDRGLDKR